MNSVIVCGAFAGDEMIKTGVEMIKNVCNCASQVLNGLQGIGVLDKGSAAAAIVSSAATTIATLLVVIELCTQAMGFHFDDINDAVRFVFKVVVYKIIIENSSKIVNLVYGMFMTSTAWNGVSTGFAEIGERFVAAAGKITNEFNTFSEHDDSFLGFDSLLVGLFLLIASIIAVFLCVTIIASIAGLIFELCINVAIAPVPIATLVNSQTRQIGIGFIKGFAGNCLQLTMYTICFTIYTEIADNIGSSFGTLLSTGQQFSTIGVFIPEIVGLVLLSVAIKNVGAMINKVLS